MRERVVVIAKDGVLKQSLSEIPQSHHGRLQVHNDTPFCHCEADFVSRSNLVEGHGIAMRSLP
jgi:hypothetical protein